MTTWRERWQERKERRKKRLLRRRRRQEIRREKREKKIEGVRIMKEGLIIRGIIAILRSIMPALEKRAKETPSPIDDIVIGVLKAIIGMEEDVEGE